jgi:hypothetical protein
MVRAVVGMRNPMLHSQSLYTMYSALGKDAWTATSRAIYGIEKGYLIRKPTTSLALNM